MCSVRWRMRSVRSAIWTSAEPVSESWSLLSLIVAALSGIRACEPSSIRQSFDKDSAVEATRTAGVAHALGSLLGGQRSDPFDVEAHLSDQIVDRIESLLAAEPVQEADPSRLAVEITVEIEDVGLHERQSRVGVEGGPSANGDRGRSH